MVIHGQKFKAPEFLLFISPKQAQEQQRENIKGERVWCCGIMITAENHANVRLPAFTKRVRNNTRAWWLSITFHTGKSLLSEKCGNRLSSAQKISMVLGSIISEPLCVNINSISTTHTRLVLPIYGE